MNERKIDLVNFILVVVINTNDLILPKSIVGSSGREYIREGNMEGFRPRQLSNAGSRRSPPTVSTRREVHEIVLLHLLIKGLLEHLLLLLPQPLENLTGDPMLHHLEEPPLLGSPSYLPLALLPLPLVPAQFQAAQVDHRKLPLLHHHPLMITPAVSVVGVVGLVEEGLVGLMKRRVWIGVHEAC